MDSLLDVSPEVREVLNRVACYIRDYLKENTADQSDQNLLLKDKETEE